MGIENTETGEVLQVSVYPNPATYAFQVDIPHKLIGGRFAITNSMGQLLQQGVLDAPSTIFDINNYAQGVYFISIYSSFGEKSIRFVKN